MLFLLTGETKESLYSQKRQMQVLQCPAVNTRSLIRVCLRGEVSRSNLIQERLEGLIQLNELNRQISLKLTQLSRQHREKSQRQAFPRVLRSRLPFNRAKEIKYRVQVPIRSQRGPMACFHHHHQLESAERNVKEMCRRCFPFLDRLLKTKQNKILQ